MKKIVFLITLIVLIIYYPRNSLTVYQISKKNKHLALNPTTYYISTSGSMIFYETLDDKQPFGQCNVLDLYNWQCTYPNSPDKVIMNDGTVTYHIQDKTVNAFYSEYKQTNFINWALISYFGFRPFW